MKTPLMLLLTAILFSCENKQHSIEVKLAAPQAATQLSDSAFDRHEFDRKFETVKWLLYYDQVAWVTSDEIQKSHSDKMKDLGKEWFCFEDTKNVWHALYGKFEHNVFNTVLHFMVDSTHQPKLSHDEIDTLTLNSFGRALSNANQKFSKINDSLRAGVGFNQFIQKNADSSLTVYILPAIQQNNVAVYGGEFIYTFDKFGVIFQNDESYFQGNFRGFQTDPTQEIELNYSEKANPTLGSIFLTWYFKDYFSRVVLYTQKARSSPFKHQEDNSYYWVHALVDQKR